MNKDEIKNQFNKLLEEKMIDSIVFPEISEPTFLKVLVGSDSIENEEKLMDILKKCELGKWSIFYLKNVKSVLENPINKNYFMVDLISSEYLDGWKRAKADFINYQREEKERVANLVKFSNQSILEDLVTVLDSFDLGLATIKDTDVKKGVFLIKNQLEELLKKYGLEKIEVKVGEKYDPALEEIVDLKEDKEEGKILEVLTPGYKLYEKILRPARVIVSKGQEEKGQKNK